MRGDHFLILLAFLTCQLMFARKLALVAVTLWQVRHRAAVQNPCLPFSNRVKHRAAILRPIASHAFAREETILPHAILECAVLGRAVVTGECLAASRPLARNTRRSTRLFPTARHARTGATRARIASWTMCTWTCMTTATASALI